MFLENLEFSLKYQNYKLVWAEDQFSSIYVSEFSRCKTLILVLYKIRVFIPLFFDCFNNFFNQWLIQGSARWVPGTGQKKNFGYRWVPGKFSLMPTPGLICFSDGELSSSAFIRWDAEWTYRGGGVVRYREGASQIFFFYNIYII